MDSKVNKLAKLLGVGSDFYEDYYQKTKKKFKQGIFLEFYDIFGLNNEESLKSSFLASLKPWFLLMNNSKLLRDSIGYIPLWEEELLQIAIWNNSGKLILCEEITVSSLDSPLKDKLFNSQLELIPKEEVYVGRIRLVKPTVQRLLLEKIQETTEQSIGRELRYLKESFLLYLTQANSLDSLQEEAVLLFHRLKLWNYDYNDKNFPFKQGSEIIDSLVVSNPGFEDLWEIEQLRHRFFKNQNNEELITQIKKDRKAKEKENFLKIKKLKTYRKTYSSFEVSMKSKNS